MAENNCWTKDMKTRNIPYRITTFIFSTSHFRVSRWYMSRSSKAKSRNPRSCTGKWFVNDKSMSSILGILNIDVNLVLFCLCAGLHSTYSTTHRRKGPVQEISPLIGMLGFITVFIHSSSNRPNTAWYTKAIAL